MNNRLFKNGDLVVCIDPGNDKLTVGKTYMVFSASILPCGLDEWDLFLDVCDDYGKNGYSYAHRFIHLAEYLNEERKRKFKELGI
jgi:hypothetical protein